MVIVMSDNLKYYFVLSKDISVECAGNDSIQKNITIINQWHETLSHNT